MATGPKIPTDPLELLTPDLTRPEPYLNKYWGAIAAGGLTWGCILFTNLQLRKPVFSNLHYQVIYTGAAAAIGQYFDNKRKNYLAERDAVLRHYIQLHPDDFPACVPKKYSELLLPWHPIR